MEELDPDIFRENFLKYTIKAFKMLPEMDKPRILDIGCGTGQPTLELAQLSNGEVIGIDIDQNVLNKLNLKIEANKLSGRVRTINCSIYITEFSDEDFNILWDEGVIHTLDLKKGLKECSRLLKPNGFLVIGETIKWIHDKFEVFSEYGFKLMNHFLLPEKSWLTEYYEPMEKKINELRVKYSGSKELDKLKPYESEVEMVKKNPKEFDCGFYIMQKIE